MMSDILHYDEGRHTACGVDQAKTSDRECVTCTPCASVMASLDRSSRDLFWTKKHLALITQRRSSP